jgi:FkbM family methyltransferase
VRADNEITAIDLKKTLLPPQAKPIIFDVGAYTGQTVSGYLSSFPEANIFAFEPTPISYAQLKQKFDGNKQVRCINFAISDSAGVIPFHLNEFSPTNSTLSTDASANEYWGNELLSTVETVSVQSESLDKVCQNEDIDHIDILKLDVQGAELKVLKGAERMLNERRISIIYLEIIFVPTYKGQSTYYEIGEYLSTKGFDIYGIFNLTYDKRLKQADVLFYRG